MTENSWIVEQVSTLFLSEQLGKTAVRQGVYYVDADLGSQANTLWINCCWLLGGFFGLFHHLPDCIHLLQAGVFHPAIGAKGIFHVSKPLFKLDIGST